MTYCMRPAVEVILKSSRHSKHASQYQNTSNVDIYRPTYTQDILPEI